MRTQYRSHLGLRSLGQPINLYGPLTCRSSGSRVIDRRSAGTIEAHRGTISVSNYFITSAEFYTDQVVPRKVSPPWLTLLSSACSPALPKSTSASSRFPSPLGLPSPSAAFPPHPRSFPLPSIHSPEADAPSPHCRTPMAIQRAPPPPDQPSPPTTTRAFSL